MKKLLLFIVLGISLTSPAYAAPAYVQHVYNSTFAGVASSSLPSTVSGNTIIATSFIGTNADTVTIAGCGNNWTLLNHSTSTADGFYMWLAPAPGGTCNATATPSANNNTLIFSLTEFSGINGTDTTPIALQNAFCTSCKTATTTPTTNGDLVVAFASDGSGFQTFSAITNGFTINKQATSTSAGQQNTAEMTASLVQSTAAAISTAWTVSTGSSNERSYIVAFKATVTIPGATPIALATFSSIGGLGIFNVNSTLQVGGSLIVQ